VLLVRCLYLDLDGTLLGPGGSLFHDADGAVTLLGARAVEACLRAGVEVVPVSGRRGANVREDARLLGARSFVFEAGACVVLDGEEHWLTAPWLPEDGRSIHEQVAGTGAPDLLLERFADRLEHHAPWHVDREVSHLFRGLIDTAEAELVLREHGHETLRLVDNGKADRRSASLAGLPQVRVYHLVPAAASKARAVAAHRRMRGYAREECVAAGDSREDLRMAGEVGAFWLVANALEADPTLRDELGRVPGLRVAEGRNGAGVYEAVVTTLAERRG
jgi:hydroxymethylpyrimidine pyrophosphatase-like HAD family hydrolase